MTYLDKDLTTIHEALVNKEVNPKELADEARSKIAKTNGKLNAFNLVIDNEEYKESDSILCGIPYALKDNLSTKGIKTTACSDTLKDYVPVFNATAYEKLCDSGALLIGKTNLDELAMGGTGTTGNTGIVHNPWNISHMAGGSSAGSASSVAAGIVPYAIGSDTGDSIRKPAAFCGVVGFKPSYGLISRYGLFAFASSLDHVGVFTRNVKDAAIIVDHIKGYDKKDMTSIRDMDDVSLVNGLDGNIKGKKLFYIDEICNKDNYDNPKTKEMLDNFDSLLEKAKDLGFEVYKESVDIKLLNAIKPIYDCISCAEATSNNSNLTGIPFGPRGNGENVMDMMKDARTKGFSPLIKRRFVIGSFILQKENQEKYFLNAKRVRRLLVEIFNKLFEKYDGLILPCSSAGAPSLEQASDKITRNDIILENHLAIGNFGGYPSITIPCGFIDKMPIGVNITGKFKGDANVLNMAYALENTLEFKNQTAKGEF
ncbi:MAG: Asp-tRNA(Asn)/Glu-tRNA(Gln) amidotransferase subunit GatA [Bacilli bacterium]|nr:Asp-tRNA(Asn)/Glu-tRNA(Gln) amidotransferase subunit GatA [Bacilli bacterium]